MLLFVFVYFLFLFCRIDLGFANRAAGQVTETKVENQSFLFVFLNKRNFLNPQLVLICLFAFF